MKLLRFIVIVLVILTITGIHHHSESGEQGKESVPFLVDSEFSRIDGSIKYTVIGRYNAYFERYGGEFYFNDKNIAESWVILRIESETLTSVHPKLDKIARRIFEVEKFPEILFKSTSIQEAEEPGIYSVTGDLSLHGVTKEISFPFQVDAPQEDQKRSRVSARGTWIIKRKDFDVIWHPIFDRGGILVGNHMTVDWEIVAFR